MRRTDGRTCPGPTCSRSRFTSWATRWAVGRRPGERGTLWTRSRRQRQHAGLGAGSTLWLYDNGNGSLWTEWNSGGVAGGLTDELRRPGHFAPLGTSAVRLGVTYFGAAALMNASRSIACDHLRHRDGCRSPVYGYTVTRPSTYGTTYGQLDADGTLRIDTSSLGNSADAITLSGSGGVLSLTLDTGTPRAGIDPPGAILSIFDLSAVDEIEIDTGGGPDTISIGAGVPTTAIFGGAGGINTDTLIINGATGTAGLTTGTFTAGAQHHCHQRHRRPRPQRHQRQRKLLRFRSSRRRTCHDQRRERHEQPFPRRRRPRRQHPRRCLLHLQRWLGGDGLIISNQNNNSLTWVNEIFPSSADFFAAGYFLNINYSSVEAVTIEGSQRNDQFVVAAGSPNTITLNGNAGNDSFNVGGGNLLSAAGLANMNGGLDNDMLILNDSLSTHNLPWTINGDNGPSPANRIFLGINEFSFAGFESVGLLGGTVGQEFRISGNLAVGLNIDGGGGGDTIVVGFQSKAQFGGPVVIHGGAGNDNYQWNRGSNNWYQGFVDISLYDVLLDGGTGYNTLAIDETTRSAAGYYLYADRFYATDGAVFPVGFDVDYDNMQAMSFGAGGGTTNVGVYGTSSDIDVGNQISMSLGGGTDNVYLYPHDAQGNLTINGNVGIGGGAGTDSLYVDDSASSVPAAYAFANPFGAGTQNITGVGSGGFGVANDFEAITMTGSDGDDVYNINSYKSVIGLTINGGGGDDALEITPISKNLYDNMAAGSGVNNILAFHGGAGYDTFGVHNDNNDKGYSYTINAAAFTIHNSFTSPLFAAFMSQTEVEYTTLTAGPQSDSILVQNTAANTFHDFDGGPGVAKDTFAIGYPLSPALTSVIRGGVRISGGGGDIDEATVYNFSDTIGRTFHIENDFIGRMPGDNLFGPGGYLQFVGIAGPLTIRLGSGSDVVYAAPHVVTPIVIHGNNPTAAPGDNFRLSLAGVTNPVITPNGAAQGRTRLATPPQSSIQASRPLRPICRAIIVAMASWGPKITTSGEAVSAWLWPPARSATATATASSTLRTM